VKPLVGGGGGTHPIIVHLASVGGGGGGWGWVVRGGGRRASSNASVLFGFLPMGGGGLGGIAPGVLGNILRVGAVGGSPLVPSSIATERGRGGGFYLVVLGFAFFPRRFLGEGFPTRLFRGGVKTRGLGWGGCLGGGPFWGGGGGGGGPGGGPNFVFRFKPWGRVYLVGNLGVGGGAECFVAFFFGGVFFWGGGGRGGLVVWGVRGGFCVWGGKLGGCVAHLWGGIGSGWGGFHHAVWGC